MRSESPSLEKLIKFYEIFFGKIYTSFSFYFLDGGLEKSENFKDIKINFVSTQVNTNKRKTFLSNQRILKYF